jgi:hypothetical protein
VHKFENLEVWQLAVAYCDLCYAISEKLPSQENFNLASQLRRASVSEYYASSDITPFEQ